MSISSLPYDVLNYESSTAQLMSYRSRLLSPAHPSPPLSLNQQVSSTYVALTRQS